ncbi:MAG: hypothetical protein H0X26_10620, partial [Alphaproteobacteria bacterium]|nr:hypothetical protein [Alphaproteobacteria bacterium]
MKKFLAYLISTSIICSPIRAKPPLEHIKDLDAPFISKNKRYLSIAVGADNRYIRGVRFHGNYSAKKSPFPCVEHNQLKEDDRPQDAVTAVLQRFFPSPLHDALVPNNLQQDQLKKWLTPECGAHIINHIDDNGKFSQLSNEEQVLGIVKALTPHAYWTEALKAPMQAKLTKQSETKVLYSRLQGRDSFKFANLFVQAIKQSRNPTPEDEYLYDPHIIETGLLTYLWQQAQAKQDFEPYYKTLSKDIVDKTVTIDFNSFYTKDNYCNLQESIVLETLSIEEFMSSPEKMTLLTQGSSYYEDPLPPSSAYSSVLFQEADGKNYIYTNCGENALMDLLNMVMFDPEQRSFAYAQPETLTAKGLDPLKEFSHFYKEIQIYPHQSNLQKTLNAWSQLVSNRNIPNDPDPIHYLKKQGVRVKKETMDGNYELENGLHNILRVIGKFLNDPLWQPMNQKGKELLTAIQENLDRFCTLFSRENFLLDWQVSSTKNKEIKHSTDITIAFSVGGENRFELCCGLGHFNLNKYSQAENEEYFGDLGSRIIPHIKQWNPLYLEFLKAMTTLPVTFLKDDIFSPFQEFEDGFYGVIYGASRASLKVNQPLF